MSGLRVMLALPGGPFCAGTVRGALMASEKHSVGVDFNGNGWDDFDHLWSRALNRAEAGELDLFAMLHADVAPQAGWIDVLEAERERLDADMVSAAIPLKDTHGLTSCGVGIPGHPWGAFRRVAVRELSSLPVTFGAADIGYPDHELLCNSGCWIADLRRPIFRTTELDGSLALSFDFPRRHIRYGDQWRLQRESEDYHFSRKLNAIGGRYFNTRAVAVAHMDGNTAYPNHRPWGEWEHDEETRPLWEAGPLSHLDIQGWFDFADLYQRQVNAVNGKPATFVEVGCWQGKSTAFLAQQVRQTGKRIRIDAIDNWQGGTDGPANSGGIGAVGACRSQVAASGVDLFSIFNRNLTAARVSEYVRPVRANSAEAAAAYPDRSLDFVFIDADHDEPAVYADLSAWWPKVRPGGTLAGHDYDEDGPRLAATRFGREKSTNLQADGRCFVMVKA